MFANTKISSTFAHANENNAEVAQLVEHNLAKVRVAGSSPVFRSLPKGLGIACNIGAFYFVNRDNKKSPALNARPCVRTKMLLVFPMLLL